MKPSAQTPLAKRWVRFDDTETRLQRMLLPDNAVALILRTSPGEKGKVRREKAKEIGFFDMKTPGMMAIKFDEGAITFTPRQVAEALDGETFTISIEEFNAPKWTINASDRASTLNRQSPKKASIQPDVETVSTIGLNIKGEEVVRDKTGRFFRKMLEDGRPSFVHEQQGDAPTLFLRARNRADLEVIAACLVGMASRQTLHQRDFDRVVEAAVEPGPHGAADVGLGEARDLVRGHMLREISGIAIENDASRERFSAALRLASATGYILSRETNEGDFLSPSPAMAAFMRRATRGYGSVNFHGSNDLALAMPRLKREESDLQVHDLAGMSSDSLSGYVANVLSRRDADGRSIFRLPLSSENGVAERLRFEIGRFYALEAVADVSPVVADGVQDNVQSTLFFVGERRPEPLDSLPEAAYRTFKVVIQDDLISLEREINRSRARIREFHEVGETPVAEDANDAREDNERQRPYTALSKVSEPFTMVPVALEGATMKALERIRRDFEGQGGVDAVVANSMGLAIDELAERLTAEQVDAIGLRIHAQSRGRGFAEIDQTGVGKGRALAAMAMIDLRRSEDRKVLYLTESGIINVPDVCRDLKAVGAWKEGDDILLMARGSVYISVSTDPETGEEIAREHKSLSDSQRKAIYKEGVWPEGKKIIISSYSQFNGKETADSSQWLRTALDRNTTLVLDEAQNALNKSSRQGRNIRQAIDQVGAENVIFGTATHLRNLSGVDLYEVLLPQSDNANLQGILDNIKSGGEVAQETFTTMLAEDGVLIRRDHDLSNIEFIVALPSDERMIHYQKVMDKFSPIVELMIQASGEISEILGRRSANLRQRLLNEGVDPADVDAQVNELNQYSIGLGSPLADLAIITLNALKVDQVVDEALQEISEGRKPLITFHSTNSALIEERARGENGKLDADAMAAASDLDLRDQIRRIHDRIYRVKIDGEKQDARLAYPNVQEIAEMINQRIDEIPSELSVSPLDAVIERLEQHDLAVGEISGRKLCYRNNRIERRQNLNRAETVRQFNGGELDVLIYNQAGATGGSFHASAEFADQRPRTMLEMETARDIIKYVQALGRGNRYGQVAKPRVKSVSSGLIPEMRINQQRNRKLRSLGASVDGNRSHPLLLDDIPDFLNRVGDEATMNVLLQRPALARKLGFSDLVDKADEQNRNALENEDDSGSDIKVVDSLSNRVLSRSIMLGADEQNDLVEHIRLEFDAMIEELESRNANPLKPKQLEGTVEIKATSIFSGMERADDDLDASAFMSPLYISTAVHHFDEEAWTGEQLVSEVEACRRLYGADGFARWGEMIRQNLSVLLRHRLPEGIEMAEAMRNPQRAGIQFKYQHQRLNDFAWLLDNIRPGAAICFPSETDPMGTDDRIIVGLVPPPAPSLFSIASAYKIKTIMPGMARPETTALSRVIGQGRESVDFHPGISESYDERFIDKFEQDRIMTRRFPVQVLTGNILQALKEAATHNLGAVSLYTDQDRKTHRGVVVQKRKVDLDLLPAAAGAGSVPAEFVHRFLQDELLVKERTILRMWGAFKHEDIGERDSSEIDIWLSPKHFQITAAPLRKSNYAEYANRPGLYDLMWGKPLPSYEEAPEKAFVRSGSKSKYSIRVNLESDEDRKRVLRIMKALDSALMVDGLYRPDINKITNEHQTGEVMTHETYIAELTPEEDANRIIDIDPETGEAILAEGPDPASLPSAMTVAPAPAEGDIDLHVQDEEMDEMGWG